MLKLRRVNYLQIIIPKYYFSQTDTRYFKDLRTPKQVQLSNHLIEKLTQLNLNTQNRLNIPCSHQNKDVLTIAINGVPADHRQWQGFIFPGKFIVYNAPGCETEGTDQYFQSRLKNFSPQKIANEIDQIVQKYGKKVILVYHSFGSFAATFYCHYFPHKIIGLIEFGAFPITDYNLSSLHAELKKTIPNQNYFYQQKQVLYQKYLEKMKGAYQRAVSNKYQHLYINLCLFTTCQYFYQMRRNLPKVLKLMIFGRSDKIFPKEYMNESAVYYAYENKLEPNYENNLKQTYEKLTDLKIQNIQERFIFSIAKRGHSVHLVSKPIIKAAMNIYLATILKDIPQILHL